MTDKIANAGTTVVEAKAGKGSATLSMVRAASLPARDALIGPEASYERPIRSHALQAA
jgi:hypothetical protein